MERIKEALKIRGCHWLLLTAGRKLQILQKRIAESLKKEITLLSLGSRQSTQSQCRGLQSSGRKKAGEN